jgi:geranylgeranyl pyrophosphate synthase
MDHLDPPIDRVAFEAALVHMCDTLGRTDDDGAEYEDGPASKIVEAMRYVMTSGGKRLRAALCFAGFRYAHGNAHHPHHPLVTAAAAGVEMLHAASLVLDDLPCMDDADVRRSRPCVHLVHGEALSVLAASALVVRAIRVALVDDHAEGGTQRGNRVAGELLRSAENMAMGQALDLELAAKPSQKNNSGSLVEAVRRAHAGKTGALITASVVCGAICGGGDRDTVARAKAYGMALGAAFQIADDVIDATRTSREAGKPTGADAGKASSYVEVAGMEAALARIRELEQTAIDALASGADGSDLVRIARMVCNTV